MIRTAESPLGQIVASVAAWFFLLLALIPMILMGMVPGNRATDFLIPLGINIFLVIVGLILNWVGSAVDRSEEHRGIRLVVFRVVAASVILWSLGSVVVLYLRLKQ